MIINREDLTWAAEQNLITEAQAANLWNTLAARQPERPRFELAHVIYYFGGLIIVAAMTWFMTEAWETLGGLGIAAVATSYAALFAFIGHRLWFGRSLKIPGGILFTAAVCMTPLIIYGLERLTGLWPQGDPGSYADYHQKIKGSWILMEVGTIAIALAVLRHIRFPFLTFPIAFSLWYMSMDLTPLLFGEWNLSSQQSKTVSVVFGLVMLFVAYLFDRRTREDYAFWGYLFGLMTFWGGLTMMNSGSELGKFFYCLLNVGLIFLSVFLSRRVFIVFGAMGLIAYLGYLADTVFKDSLFFPVALSSIGLLIIFAGVQYQRHQSSIEKTLDSALPDFLKRLRPTARG